MVIRIMLMVPIYAIASLIALFSLEAAFVIDVIRDIYEVMMQPYPGVHEADQLCHSSGVCDILFLSAVGWLYGRGTISPYSSPWTASEGCGVPFYSAPPRTRPE
jgi:hypothetical protein